jgi:expansin
MRRLVLCLLLASCDSGAGPSGTSSPVVIGDAGTMYFGATHSGNFWLGPVDYSESQFHNACGPSDGKYPALIQQLYGNDIMGLSNQLSLDKLAAGVGQLCDVCAELTANGQTLIAHVVTYGDETGVDDIDVSVQVHSALGGATSSKLTWRFVTCPTTHPIYYTFDGREWSNTWYFRVWIRNARVPVAKVEYQLAGKSWAAMNWQDDGAWEIDSKDFSAGFSLRVTAIDGQTVEDAIPGIGTFNPNDGIASKSNFQ